MREPAAHPWHPWLEYALIAVAANHGADTYLKVRALLDALERRGETTH